jgi:hypothetical protein
MKTDVRCRRQRPDVRGQKTECRAQREKRGSWEAEKMNEGEGERIRRAEGEKA